jgi:hypothetical protein
VSAMWSCWVASFGLRSSLTPLFCDRDNVAAEASDEKAEAM